MKLLESEQDLSVQDASFQKIMEEASNSQRQYLEVQVEDTGVGIKEEDQCKLFQLFGFLESGQDINPKGIGLGLNISKKITKMFDGDIICRSKYGVGTNFIFIVALDNQRSDSHYQDTSSQRIKNPNV